MELCIIIIYSSSCCICAFCMPLLRSKVRRTQKHTARMCEQVNSRLACMNDICTRRQNKACNHVRVYTRLLRWRWRWRYLISLLRFSDVWGVCTSRETRYAASLCFVLVRICQTGIFIYVVPYASARACLPYPQRFLCAGANVSLSLGGACSNSLTNPLWQYWRAHPFILYIL